MPQSTPYSYRHTFATAWPEQGRSVDILAELLGNSPAVIRKHYSHLLGTPQTSGGSWRRSGPFRRQEHKPVRRRPPAAGVRGRRRGRCGRDGYAAGQKERVEVGFLDHYFAPTAAAADPVMGGDLRRTGRKSGTGTSPYAPRSASR